METANKLKEIDMKMMGRRIRTQREAIHMTRNQLAAKLGVSGKFIADIEYGDKGMSIQTLSRHGLTLKNFARAMQGMTGRLSSLPNCQLTGTEAPIYQNFMI